MAVNHNYNHNHNHLCSVLATFQTTIDHMSRETLVALRRDINLIFSITADVHHEAMHETLERHQKQTKKVIQVKNLGMIVCPKTFLQPVAVAIRGHVTTPSSSAAAAAAAASARPEYAN